MTKRITIKTHEDALNYLYSVGYSNGRLEEDENGELSYSETVTCRRCGGAGYYPSQFHGACYECGGRPPKYIVKHTLVAIAKKARKAELAAAGRERKAARKEEAFVAAANEKRAEFDASFPGFASELEGKTHSILIDLAEKLAKWGSLSEKQVAFARKLIAEADAPKGKLEEGRREMTGKVVGCKWRESNYGGAYKMTVALDDGTRVWGSVPSALEDAVSDHYYGNVMNNATFRLCEIIKGATVTFSATVTPSDDDPSFGFFKRPSKATLDAVEWVAPKSVFDSTVNCEHCDGYHHSHDCRAHNAHCARSDDR